MKTFFISESLMELIDKDIIQKLKWIYLLHGYDYEVQFWLDTVLDGNGEPVQEIIMWVFNWNTELFMYQFNTNKPVSDIGVGIKPIGKILLVGELDNFTSCPIWDFVYCIKILLKAI